jgi:urease subunit beta
MIPGEYLLESEPIDINVGRSTIRLAIRNRGDRPIQVGSHCHFFEVNRWLAFERPRAYGMRLNIAAGTAVRFEPGDEREVELVAFGGARHVHGVNGLVDGPLDDEAVRKRALTAVNAFAPPRPKPEA